MTATPDITINKLGYRLLGVLVRQPSTGYDIVKALEKFRPVQISQVYPLLSEMESLGLLVSEEIVQTGKPNRKIYHPTERADEVLRIWMDKKTEEPIQRDDFVAKIYSLWKALPEQRQRLLKERMSWLDEEIAFFSARLRELHETHDDTVIDDPDNWQFCRDVLMRRRLVLYREELLWCHRVLQKIKRTAEAIEDSEEDQK